MQAVKPYFTPADTEKGAKWDSEISEQLQQTNICIIALTHESLSSSWMMFEAGAISCKIERARVCAILFNLEQVDVPPPLSQFQLTTFKKPDIRLLLKTINSYAGEAALGESNLDASFEKWWPNLEKEVSKIQRSTPTTTAAPRPEREILEELLLICRQLQESEFSRRFGPNPGFFTDHSFAEPAPVASLDPTEP